MIAFENKSYGEYFVVANRNLRHLATIKGIGKIYENKTHSQYYWLAEGADGKSEAEAMRVIEPGEIDETVEKIWKVLEEKGKL